MAFGILVCFIVMSLSGLGCTKTEPLQTPPAKAVPSSDLYNSFLSEESDNPTLFKHKVDSKPRLSFTLKITKIEDAKIQQHFEEPVMGPDSYIECDFEREQSVFGFKNGETVSVYGTLHDAFGKKFWVLESKAIKFRDCGRLDNG